MYVQVDQFAVDKFPNVLVEEGIAPAFIREFHRRRGRRCLRVEKNLGDLAQSRKCDLVDTFGLKWEVKADRLWHVTGNVYVELQALQASEADYYLVFAGMAFIVEKRALAEEFARQTALTPGGDNDRSLGILLPLERLEEISEVITL